MNALQHLFTKSYPDGADRHQVLSWADETVTYRFASTVFCLVAAGFSAAVPFWYEVSVESVIELFLLSAGLVYFMGIGCVLWMGARRVADSLRKIDAMFYACERMDVNGCARHDEFPREEWRLILSEEGRLDREPVRSLVSVLCDVSPETETAPIEESVSAAGPSLEGSYCKEVLRFYLRKKGFVKDMRRRFSPEIEEDSPRERGGPGVAYAMTRH